VVAHSSGSLTEVIREGWSVILHTVIRITRTLATLSVSLIVLKGIGKEFQQLVIRRYLEKSIQKKLFCHLQSLQIKSIFQEICEIYSVTVVVYVIYIYGGRDVIGDNCNIVCKYCLFIS